LQLIGVSTVAGNAPGPATCANAAQLLTAFGAPDSIELWRGSDEPLLKPPRSGDVEIHGTGGLGGVTGLPPLSSPAVQRRFTGPRASVYNGQESLIPPHEPAAVVNRLAEIIRSRMMDGRRKLHICITGPCTNIGMFCKMYPHLLAGVEQIVLMGGTAAGAGNRGPLAEFNILCDPEAATIVFDANVKVVMAGLNVTHSAIFTQKLHARLLKGSQLAPIPESGPSPLRRTLSSILTFFSSTYANVFGFMSGPPVHDSLAVMYVIDPLLFWTYGPPTTATNQMRPSYKNWVETGLFEGAGVPDPDFHSDDDDDDDDDEEEEEGGWGGGANKDVPMSGIQALESGLGAQSTGGASGATRPTLGPTSSGSGGGDVGASSGGIDDMSRIPYLTAVRSAKSPEKAARLRSFPPKSMGMGPFFRYNKPVVPPQRYRVKVECTSGALAEGATVVDWWSNWGVEHEGWSRGGKNVEVLEEVNVEHMWNIFFEVVDRAEKVLHPGHGA
ncbi:Uridine nucleosidase 1, partial [Tilletia horrida]